MTLPSVKKLKRKPNVCYEINSGEAFVYTYNIFVWYVNERKTHGTKAGKKKSYNTTIESQRVFILKG